MIDLKSLGAGLVLAVAAASSAQAQGETMKDLLGAIGIIDKQGPAIEYRERAPLVLPPRAGAAAALPAPKERGRARENAQWPNDPDVAARRAAAAEARTPTTETYTYRMNSSDNRLSLEEMRAGRTNRPSDLGPVGSGTDTMESISRPVSPNELRQRTADAEEVPFGAEPPRRLLTQPPVGYRKAVSSAPVKVDFDPPGATCDVGDPSCFHQEQRARR